MSCFSFIYNSSSDEFIVFQVYAVDASDIALQVNPFQLRLQNYKCI
jgi:hypothetical protein